MSVSTYVRTSVSTTVRTSVRQQSNSMQPQTK